MQENIGENIKLYKNDCLEMLHTIKDKSIDLLITDPPYLHVKGGMRSKRFNCGSWAPKSYTMSKMSDFNRDKIFKFLDLVKPKMKKLNMYIFCSKLQLVSYFEWILKNKTKFDLLVWDKNKRTMRFAKSFTQDIEYIIRIYEDKVSLNKITGDNGKIISHYYTKRQMYLQPKGGHETMKPLELITNYILLSSQEGDLVLDPFMGSGTTGVACINTNRRFIGIEIEEKYFELSKKRIKETLDKSK